MMAAHGQADGFISLAGPSERIDETILKQVEASAPNLSADTKRVFEILRSGKTTDDYPIGLASVFNKPTQPFIAEWMQYAPLEEIKKLDMPILIINGSNDFQVTQTDAKTLHAAVPDSKLALIENMNHALVLFEGTDKLANMKSYSDINRPLSAELISLISNFILN